MSAFALAVKRTGCFTWNELTHKQQCRLVALWIDENRNELDDILFDLEPEKSIADEAITRFDAKGRNDTAVFEHARRLTVEQIDTAILARAKRSAERGMRMNRDWLQGFEELERRLRVPGVAEYQEP
jgi:hypothetical protein